MWDKVRVAKQTKIVDIKQHGLEGEYSYNSCDYSSNIENFYEGDTENTAKVFKDIFDHDEYIGQDIAKLFEINEDGDSQDTTESQDTKESLDSEGSRTPTQNDYPCQEPANSHLWKYCTTEIPGKIKDTFSGFFNHISDSPQPKPTDTNIDDSGDDNCTEECVASKDSSDKNMKPSKSYSYHSYISSSTMGNPDSSKLDMDDTSYKDKCLKDCSYLEDQSPSSPENTTTKERLSIGTTSSTTTKPASTFAPFSPTTYSELQKELDLTETKLQDIVSNSNNRVLTQTERENVSDLIKDKKYYIDQQKQHISSQLNSLKDDNSKNAELLKETKNLVSNANKLQQDIVEYSNKLNQDIVKSELDLKLNTTNISTTSDTNNSAVSEGLGTWRQGLTKQEQQLVDSFKEAEIKKQIKIRIEMDKHDVDDVD